MFLQFAPRELDFARPRFGMLFAMLALLLLFCAVPFAASARDGVAHVDAARVVSPAGVVAEIRAGDLNTASEDLGVVLASRPMSAKAWFLMSDVDARMGERVNAADALAEVSRLDPAVLVANGAELARVQQVIDGASPGAVFAAPVQQVVPAVVVVHHRHHMLTALVAFLVVMLALIVLIIFLEEIVWFFTPRRTSPPGATYWYGVSSGGPVPPGPGLSAGGARAAYAPPPPPVPPYYGYGMPGYDPALAMMEGEMTGMVLGTMMADAGRGAAVDQVTVVDNTNLTYSSPASDGGGILSAGAGASSWGGGSAGASSSTSGGGSW